MARRVSLFEHLLRKILFKKDYVKVDGSLIALPDRRWCGPDFKNDQYYLQSTENEVKRLIDNLSCSKSSRILDVGCGQGRLAVGLTRVLKEVIYHGIDVDKDSVMWCQKYISKHYTNMEFSHLNVYNERYNKEGVIFNNDFLFELQENSFDIAYLYSVFSHMTEEDMRIYLQDLKRVLTNKGKIFFTTYVEEDVTNYEVNPKDYHVYSETPLHVVRYRKEYLLSILDECGYKLLNFTYATESLGQSAIYIEKK
ncbi:MAG: class I SAM-dependent methyltransferase [Planctomycetes bacterium]|nr:class I SAM-dependent methyltransferase [Planctomycetota bacterium]